jgi:hypothetical protein
MSSVVALVDAHVHVYPQFDAGRLLSAAARNLGAAAQRLGAASWQGYLLLTETARDHWFETVAMAAPQTGLDGWQLQRRESCELSVEATRGDLRLVIIAGRQIVTAERLELHAIGTRRTFVDGQPAGRVLADIRGSGALALLPWGVGKWVGARRPMAAGLLGGKGADRPLPSDNGGRPWFWPEPLLSLGEGPLLRGSDPLPLAGQESRAGESGCWYKRADARAAGARELIGELSSCTRAQLGPFGPDESLLRFFRNQLGLRLRRHDTR